MTSILQSKVRTVVVGRIRFWLLFTVLYFLKHFVNLLKEYCEMIALYDKVLGGPVFLDHGVYNNITVCQRYTTFTLAYNVRWATIPLYSRKPCCKITIVLIPTVKKFLNQPKLGNKYCVTHFLWLTVYKQIHNESCQFPTTDRHT